jgi:hypothetical protein
MIKATDIHSGLTLEYLKVILRYDPETGEWWWLEKKQGRPFYQPAGSRRGNKGSEYRQIKINGRYYKSSRLAYFYMTGEWPKDEIDHDDRDPQNDKWKNLKPATRSQNNTNRMFKGWVEK